MNMPYLPNQKPNNFFDPLTICLAIAIVVVVFLTAKSCKAEAVNLKIIAQIESSNNPLAYNHNSQARGLYQITPICLKEYTQMNGYLYSDPDYLFNPVFNTRVADWYLNKRIPQMLRFYKKEVNITNVLIAYNAGIRAVVKGYLPAETKQYILKYNKLKARS